MTRAAARRSRKRRFVHMSGQSRPTRPGRFPESRLAELVSPKPEAGTVQNSVTPPDASPDSRARMPERSARPDASRHGQHADAGAAGAGGHPKRANKRGRPRLHATPEIAKRVQQDRDNARRRQRMAEERDSGAADAEAAENPRHRSGTGYVNARGEIVLWGERA